MEKNGILAKKSSFILKKNPEKNTAFKKLMPTLPGCVFFSPSTTFEGFGSESIQALVTVRMNLTSLYEIPSAPTEQRPRELSAMHGLHGVCMEKW